MASTPFQVVSWSPNDPISDEKLDAMVGNDNWLRDNMLQGRYQNAGTTRDIGVKIAGGVIPISAGKGTTRTKQVLFDGYFSQSCAPIVTTGVISAKQFQIYCTISGIGNTIQPTRDGFEAHVFATAVNKHKRVAKGVYVTWQALGF